MSETDAGFENQEKTVASLSGANKELGNILTDLKGGKLSEREEEFVGKANELLCGAIYSYPHLARSVEVRLGKRAYEDSGRIDEQYSDSYRPRYRDLVDNCIKQSDKDSYSLIVSLPYGFTTGTHGSGERAAVSASRREVYFGLTYKKRGEYGLAEPCL